ncbi:MAG: ABC transporter permease [Candidatus Alcyoniella australis]|nr:ABC transporter permease [Candidatus Alcyoniella australis]
MRSRIPAVARKETLHVMRDWRTLAMAFALPMAMILLFGYGISFDIRDVKLAVADEDCTSLSRELVQSFSSSGYFKITATPTNAAELNAVLESNRAQVALAIPEGFARELEAGRGQTIQLLVDGAESNTANIASSYVEAIVNQFNTELILELMQRRGVRNQAVPPMAAQVRVWFNPLVDSATTIVPGLIAVIIIMISSMLTSLTIVREREQGSLESLFATPVRRHEVVIGKMLPYLAIVMIDCLVAAGVGVAVFNVPFNGSLTLFVLTSLVFTFAGLSIGMMASVVSSNQLLANQIVILTTMLPSLLISGFMFPLESTPRWIQMLSYVVPARYFVEICRGIMLKAQPWTELAGPTLLLLLVGLFFFSQAMLRFKKKL